MLFARDRKPVGSLERWRLTVDRRSGWILARYGASRYLGISERQVQRTLERDDAWAPCIGQLRAYLPSSLDGWKRDHDADVSTSRTVVATRSICSRVRPA